MRRSSSGGGGCGDDRPSRAGGAGLVLSWAGRWSVGVAARSSSGELVVVPSWWWWFRCLRPAGRLLGYRGDTALTPGWLGNSLGTQLLASVSSPHIYVS